MKEGPPIREEEGHCQGPEEGATGEREEKEGHQAQRGRQGGEAGLGLESQPQRGEWETGSWHPRRDWGRPEEKTALREQAEVDLSQKRRERQREEAGSDRQHWAQGEEESGGEAENDRREMQCLGHEKAAEQEKGHEPGKKKCDRGGLQ